MHCHETCEIVRRLTAIVGRHDVVYVVRFSFVVSIQNWCPLFRKSCRVNSDCFFCDWFAARFA